MSPNISYLVCKFINIKFSLFGPFLPEVWIVNVNVRSTGRHTEAGLQAKAHRFCARNALYTPKSPLSKAEFAQDTEADLHLRTNPLMLL